MKRKGSLTDGSSCDNTIDRGKKQKNSQRTKKPGESRRVVRKTVSSSACCHGTILTDQCKVIEEIVNLSYSQYIVYFYSMPGVEMFL